ncbi:phage major capsid protein, P2 family [Escherichia coli]
MKKNTRFAFNAYLQQLARLNGVAVEELSSKFTVEPSVQQTLEDQIQQSAAFLTLINVTPVTEQSGQLLGLGVGSTIAGTTDTTAKEREPVDPTLMVDVEYKCEQTNFDTVLTYAKLDLWAKFQDFQVRIRDAIVKRQALDRIMIGFNGVKRAKTSNRSENPLLQDVNKGWLQKIREDAPDHVMGSTTTGGETTPGAVKVGKGGEYTNLDAVVMDAVNELIDVVYQDDDDLVVICGRELLSDKYFPLINKEQENSEKLAADMIISQKRMGGLQAVRAPFFPPNALLITRLDITTVLDNRLMGLTLTDNRGFEADQLDLELDDADGKIVLPRRGAVITLALGWKGQPLFPKGAFTVDEIEHTGAPDRLTIRARSADFRETLNTRREKSWHKTTVGEVVKEIAARHKLKMALGKDLSDKPVEHIDQTNESDGSFLMRLARQYGAIASVKNGNLLFIRQGQGKSASGKPLPVITIIRKDGDSHRFTLADRGAYTGVIASWLHTREPAKKESTTVKRKRRTKKQKKEPEAKQGDYLVGTDENVLVLNRTYANRSNAERAAKMQWERLQRGVASFSLQLAEGRADLYTEMPVKVSGFKQPIDDAEWTITTLTHTVSPDNGFTTSLELEVKIDDFEME